MKKAYIFPGQGAQFHGMGKSLYESDKKAKELFEKANDILGFRISDIMFSGTEEELKQTKSYPACCIPALGNCLSHPARPGTGYDCRPFAG